MAITVTTDVFCGHCGTWVSGVTGGEVDESGARAKAAERGWAYRPGPGGDNVDLCEKCRVVESIGVV